MRRNIVEEEPKYAPQKTIPRVGSPTSIVRNVSETPPQTVIELTQLGVLLPNKSEVRGRVHNMSGFKVQESVVTGAKTDGDNDFFDEPEEGQVRRRVVFKAVQIVKVPLRKPYTVKWGGGRVHGGGMSEKSLRIARKKERQRHRRGIAARKNGYLN